MKQCPYCKSQMPDESKFCGECGREYPQGNTCPHCGARVYDGDVYCEKCGRNLTDGSYANSSIISDEIQEGSESSFKKYLLYILVAIALLAICGGGWWYYNSSKVSKPKNQIVVTDSIAAVDTMAAEAFEEVVDTMNIIPSDTVYFSDTEAIYEESYSSEDEVFSDTAAVFD